MADPRDSAQRLEQATELLHGAARAQTVRWAAVALTVATGALTLARLGVDGPTSAVAPILAAATLVFAAVTQQSERPLSAYLVPIMGLTALGAMAAVTEGLHSEAMYWLPLVPLLGAVLVGGRLAVALAVGASAIVTALALSDANGTAPDAQTAALALRVGSLVGAVGVGGALGAALEARRFGVAGALASRDDRQHAVLDALPFAVIVLDRTGVVLSVRNLHRAFPSSAVAVRLNDRAADVLPSQVMARVNRALQAPGEGRPIEEQVRVGEGLTARTLELLMLPLFPAGLALVFRDVTNRATLDRATDEFVSIVSHELRSPVSAILAALRMANAGVLGEMTEPMAESLAVAERSSARLARLVDDLLDLQNLASGTLQIVPAPADLREVVASAIGSMSQLALTRRVRVVLADGPPVPGKFDAARIEQLMMNLLSNAVKYSPEDGQVQVWIESMAGGLCVRIQDAGPGIPNEARTHIFAAFRQVDSSATRAVGGSGLGLAIAKHIVDAHGGELDFTSQVGEGTLFWFSIPV